MKKQTAGTVVGTSVRAGGVRLNHAGTVVGRSAIGVALVGAAWLAVGAGEAQAGSASFVKKAAGTYRTSYTVTGLGTFQGLLTLHPDGSMSASDTNDEGVLAGAKNSPGFGYWKQVGKKGLHGVIVAFGYDAAGTQTSVQVTSADATTADFVTYDFTFTLKVYGPAQDYEDPTVTAAQTFTATGQGHHLNPNL